MYKEHNDYELLYLVSENNEDAKDIFFKKYKPVVEMKAKRLYPYVKNKGYELSDLIQEGMIGLSQAINDYKEQKNVQFATFASVCIERQISTFVRNITRQKHKILNDSVSIDSTTDKKGRPLMEIIFDDKNRNPEDSLIESSEESELKEKVKKVLSEKEYEVFGLRMQGFSYQEMACLLNTTTKAIDGTMSRIKNKIININSVD